MTRISDDRTAVLSHNTLFQELNAEETEAALIRMEAHCTAYRKGETVHPVCTPFEKFGLVLSGSVNVCSDDIQGNRMLMATVEPGNTFGESLCYLDIPEPPVYAVAFSDCQILWLSVRALFRDSTDPLSLCLQKRFTAMLAKRTLAMNTRIQILSKLTLREKIMTLLSAYCEDAPSGKIILPFQREDMAAYLGTNRSALSRELTKMKSDGLLSFRKNIFELKKQ